MLQICRRKSVTRILQNNLKNKCSTINPILVTNWFSSRLTYLSPKSQLKSPAKIVSCDSNTEFEATPLGVEFLSGKKLIQLRILGDHGCSSEICYGVGEFDDKSNHLLRLMYQTRGLFYCAVNTSGNKFLIRKSSLHESCLDPSVTLLLFFSYFFLIQFHFASLQDRDMLNQKQPLRRNCFSLLLSRFLF